MLDSLTSLVNVRTAGELSTVNAQARTADPDLLSAGACVITHTLGALRGDVLPNSFRMRSRRCFRSKQYWKTTK